MYTIAIGDRTYSSWSLRGWLLFAKFDISVTVRTARMYTDEFPKMLEDFKPARTVPTICVEDLGVVWDSLAVAETLHERHPDAGIWPSAPAARAHARCLAAEMHSGFSALRNECSMNLAHSYSDFKVSDAVKADLARLELLWSGALDQFGGPWLCGEYSAVDAFFAPVAARIAGHSLPVGAQAQAYVDAHLNEGNFRRWRAMGRAENYEQSAYDIDFERAAWPGPEPLPAKAVEGVSAVNTVCPYSGKPVSEDSLAEIDGKIIGFCNQFCRDKSVADPEAWPDLVALLSGN